MVPIAVVKLPSAALSFIDVLGVLLLEIPGIPEHGIAKIHRGWRSVDRSRKTELHQGRKIPRVIDVGMGEDNGVHISGTKGEVAVDGISLRPPTLVESTIEKDSLPIDLQFMSGSSHSLRGAVKCQSHLLLLDHSHRELGNRLAIDR
jgi:hypothetical protein